MFLLIYHIKEVLLLNNFALLEVARWSQLWLLFLTACDCHPMGTSGRVCGPTGDQCPCKPSYTGAKCDQCAAGYYGFPNCRSEY